MTHFSWNPHFVNLTLAELGQRQRRYGTGFISNAKVKPRECCIQIPITFWLLSNSPVARSGFLHIFLPHLLFLIGPCLEWRVNICRSVESPQSSTFLSASVKSTSVVSNTVENVNNERPM